MSKLIELKQIQEQIQQIKRLLPKQGPIEIFVHHNTLHDLENMEFHTALNYAGGILKARSYYSISDFSKLYQQQRITDYDLDYSLKKLNTEMIEAAAKISSKNKAEFIKLLLFIPEETETSDTINWRADNGLLSNEDRELWYKVKQATSVLDNQEFKKKPSYRFRYLFAANEDFHNFCSLYFDQSIADWPITKSSAGFLNTFLKYFASSLKTKTKLNLEKKSPEITILDIINQLQVPSENLFDFINWALQDVRGWSSQVIHHEKLTPSFCNLVEFIAARLITIVYYSNWHLKTEFAIIDLSKQKIQSDLFNLLRNLTRVDNLIELCLKIIIDYDQSKRLQILQEAYEHHYYSLVAQAIKANQEKKMINNPSFSAVFCIDDREESTRRHLEEVDINCLTYGYAGFFNIDMLFKSINSLEYAALCPVNIKPVKMIKEKHYNKSPKLFYLLKFVTQLQTFYHNKTKTIFVGTLLHLGLMIQTIFVDFMRFLSPQFYAQTVKKLRELFIKANESEIELAEHFNDQQSFSIRDFAERIKILLITMGLNQKWTPTVFLIGHGSSSLNNPHAAAYNCGACSGQRGGNNARVFTLAANNPEIRKELQKLLCPIPETTIFVGGYHDTCSDEIIFYDTNKIPDSHKKIAQKHMHSIETACQLDAQERARRFESINFCSSKSSLIQVQARALKYAQPRPECGHATNALCIIGDREITRGLFLDRRAFLCSYDAKSDLNSQNLANLIKSVLPVCAGINLEYYFSYVDVERYGCGSKLPHNITGMIGVTNGPLSDLRTGLPWQMVEIHEPVRLLIIVQATLIEITKVAQLIPEVFLLAERGWVHIKIFDGVNVLNLDGTNFTSINSKQKIKSSSYEAFAENREHIDPCLIRKAI